MKNRVKFNVFWMFGIAAVLAAMVFGMAACDNGTTETPPPNSTPTAEDFDYSGFTQTTGNMRAVSITPKTGKSGGLITVYYEGTNGTSYEKATAVPSAVGTYTVTFDVAAASGWNAVSGLAAGTLIITDLVEMIRVPGGTFQMGNPNTSVGSSDERPVHEVTISAFYMGKYEVTQAQYEAVTGNNPSIFTTDADEGETQANRPVEMISWYDTLVFCNKLSMKENLTPAYSIGGGTDPAEWGDVPTSRNETWNAVTCNWNANGYRLPTEAEWEYAAKGGDGSPGNYLYSGSNTIDDVWYTTNSGSKTHEVGKKNANVLGLYDMSGNVREWCWDWYGTYENSVQSDPMGASSGSYRVIRGGSWSHAAELVRSAYRRYNAPQNRVSGDNGFRLVRPKF